MKDTRTRQYYIDSVRTLPIAKNPKVGLRSVFANMYGWGGNNYASYDNAYACGGLSYIFNPVPNLIKQVEINRRYAKGIQDTTKFKSNEQKGATTQDEAEAYRELENRLDWTPPKLLSAKVDVAASMLIAHERTFYARSTSIVHKEKREKEQNRIAGEYVMREFQQGAQAPQSKEQLDLALQEVFLPLELQMKEAIEYALYTENRWLNNIEIPCAKNMVVDDVPVIKVEIHDGGIKIRVCDIANMWFQYPTKPDFSDVTMFAECILMTQLDLKKYDTRNEYTDKDYEALPEIYYDPNTQTHYYAVIDFEKRDKASGKEFGVEDDMEVWRKGKWVVNSNMILDWGIVSGKSSFIAYCPSLNGTDKKSVSLIERVIPNVDMHYILGMNIQKELANAQTTGMAYDLESIAETMTIMKLDRPEEVLGFAKKGFYFETRGAKIMGAAAPNMRVIYGGVSPSVDSYKNWQILEENKIRDTIGIPAGVDGTTADPNTPVFAAKLAAGGSANALTVRSEGMNYLFEKTLEVLSSKIKYLVIAYRLGLIKETKYSSFFEEWAQDELIRDEEAHDFLTANFDFEFRTMNGRFMTPEVQDVLQRALQVGQIDITDYIDISISTGMDIEKTAVLLKNRIEVRRAQAAAETAANTKAQAEIQAQSMKDAADAELLKIRTEAEEKRKTDDNKARLDEELQRKKIDLEHLSAHHLAENEKGEEKGEMGEENGIQVRPPAILKGGFQIIPRKYKDIPYIVAVGDDIEAIKGIAPIEIGHGVFADTTGLIYVYLGEGEYNPTAQSISAASAILTQIETGRQAANVPKEEAKKGLKDADDLTTIATEIATVLNDIHEAMEGE